MYKFFCNNLKDNHFYFDEDLKKHINVLRLKNENILINYQNDFYECKIIDSNKALLLNKLNINNEYDFDVIVAVPLIKQSNFEIAIQKAVELGAKTIIPYYSEYTDKSNINIVNDKKIMRIKKIILEASQQSFRNIIPEFKHLVSFDELLEYPCKNKILAYEKCENNELNLISESTLFIVGPEGGFNLKEIEKSKLKNVKIVTLTKSILRSETALIYMLSRIK